MPRGEERAERLFHVTMSCDVRATDHAHAARLVTDRMQQELLTTGAIKLTLLVSAAGDPLSRVIEQAGGRTTTDKED